LNGHENPVNDFIPGHIMKKLSRKKLSWLRDRANSYSS
jgi:hypothetical protein